MGFEVGRRRETLYLWLMNIKFLEVVIRVPGETHIASDGVAELPTESCSKVCTMHESTCHAPYKLVEMITTHPTRDLRTLGTRFERGYKCTSGMYEGPMDSRTLSPQTRQVLPNVLKTRLSSASLLRQ